MRLPQRHEPAARLTYITGLRGIAALVVFGGHLFGVVATSRAASSEAVSWWTRFARQNVLDVIIWPLRFGAEMVCLFLMVSGFALWWSESQRRMHGKAETPVNVFARRRAWRLLPTYYAALTFGYVVVLLGRNLDLRPSGGLDTYSPLTWAGLLSHVFLIHNLSPAWAFQASPPLWSISAEVQVYLLFPLVTWSRYRRGPILSGVLSVIVVKTLALMFQQVGFFSLVEWFMAGVVLAEVVMEFPNYPRCALTVVATAMIVLGASRLSFVATGFGWELTWLLGFSCLILVLHATDASNVNLATHPLFVAIGRASYSLYAFHFPVVLATYWAVARLGVGPTAERLLMLVVAGPLVAGVTWLAYNWIEKPAMARYSNV